MKQDQDLFLLSGFTDPNQAERSPEGGHQVGEWQYWTNQKRGYVAADCKKIK